MWHYLSIRKDIFEDKIHKIKLPVKNKIDIYNWFDEEDTNFDP